jgi:hypothetical protein
MNLNRKLYNRRFLDGVLDKEFPYLLNDRDLEWRMFRLKVGINYSDDWGRWRGMQEGEVIFITRVLIDAFFFVDEEHYSPSFSIDDYDGLESYSCVKSDKELHWDEILQSIFISTDETLQRQANKRLNGNK